MYKNIEIVLATKHNKQIAIEKPFQEQFNANFFIPNGFDTDRFGTFTGEIERTKNPYDTVIAKATEAAVQFGFDYAIASEGSFGPHPLYFFAPCDIELISFVDKKNDLIITESEISSETNFGHIDLNKSEPYDSFLKKVKFGDHGLIVRGLEDNQVIAKGVTDFKQLETIIQSAFNTYQKIRLETDMRAMMNPTRMNVIRQVATKLVQRIKNQCKECKTPGFGQKSYIGNLPCGVCKTETELYQFVKLHCLKCEHLEIQPREDGKVYADQQYCPYCNP